MIPPVFPPLDMAPVVIIANGIFPTHLLPLKHLTQAEVVVCCDGAVEKLVRYGREPEYIVGDMDSISPELALRFRQRLHPSSCQETNDLTKAVQLCKAKGYTHVQILGATGGREDHTLANISLLQDYTQELRVEMLTDQGVFFSLRPESCIATLPGMQLSVFSLDPELVLQVTGVKYPLDKVRLDSWWKGSLNEATGTCCTFRFSAGRILVFLHYLGD